MLGPRVSPGGVAVFTTHPNDTAIAKTRSARPGRTRRSWWKASSRATGPKLSEENILSTTDLDECHGITSTIELDGKRAKTYHYVMTRDFPYSVSCFRASAIPPPGAGVG